MNRSILFFLLLLCNYAAVSQTKSPAWEWRKQVPVNAGTIALDNDDNIYICGRITQGTAPAGVNDSFALHISKYDKNGDLQWAKGYGSGFLVESDMEVDAGGNIYLQGRNQSSGNIGGFPIDHTNGDDAFVAKADANGNILWVRSQSAAGYNGIFLKLGLDNNSNTYTSGVFFNTIQLGSIQLTAGQQGAFYLAKYDKDGNVSWAKSYDFSPIAQSAQNLMATAAPDGSNYVAGRYQDSIRFGNMVLYASQWHAPYNSTFLAKHDANGNFIWAKNMTDLFPLSINTDGAANVYLTGSFSDSADLGAGTIKAEKSTDGFIAGFDKDGNIFISKGISLNTNSTFDVGISVATDNTGNVFVSGEMSALGYVRKFNHAGNVLWTTLETKSTTLPYSENIFGVRTGKAGNAYIIGAWNENGAQVNGVTIGKLGLFPTQVADPVTGNTMLHAYPNPANTSLNISSKEPFEEINIYDITGRMIYSKKTAKTKETTIDIEGLVPGMYLLEAGDGVRGRFIKE